MSDPWEYDPESIHCALGKLSTFKNNDNYGLPFAKQIPRTKFGSIYCLQEGESRQDPLVPTDLQKEQMQMRKCITKSTSRRFGQSSKKSTLKEGVSDWDASVSKVSYLDFLPNSIVRSP